MNKYAARTTNGFVDIIADRFTYTDDGLFLHFLRTTDAQEETAGLIAVECLEHMVVVPLAKKPETANGNQ